MMRIDKLKTSPDRAGRYFVQFENGTVMRLYRQNVEDFGLYEGMQLSDDQFQMLQKCAGEMSAKMRAVRIVSAANVSRKDLENRLIHKGESPSHAKQAVSWLEDLHIVDDRNTAEQIVHTCISKGYGIARAKQILYEKKIPKEYWDDVLCDYPEQLDRILSFLRSRLDEDSDPKSVKRAVDALIRRGHSYRNVREALQKMSLETDEYPEEE